MKGHKMNPTRPSLRVQNIFFLPPWWCLTMSFDQPGILKYLSYMFCQTAGFGVFPLGSLDESQAINSSAVYG